MLAYLVQMLAMIALPASVAGKLAEPYWFGILPAVDAIAVAWAKRGDFKQMANSLAKVKDPWAGQSAFAECAVLQARAGHLRLACATITRIPNVDVQVETTRAIIKAVAGKLPAQMILETSGKFLLAEQRAAAYLGLAEGIMDRNDVATAATAKVRTDE